MVDRAMRVLLIRVAPPGLAGRPPGPPPVAPPLGLLYVAAALRERAEAHVRVRHLSVDCGSVDDVEHEVRAWAPDVVGFSALSIDEVRLHGAARAARRGAPDALRVAGGPLACLGPERCLAEPAVDLAVVGEGEQTMVDVVRARADGREVRGIPGTAWRGDAGQVERAAERPLLSDLDTLPPLPWDLVDLDRYAALFNFHDLPPLGSRYAPLVTSRGCPWRCSYCHALFGRRARMHSAGRVVEDIEALVRDHDVREIHVVDDVFNLDAERMAAICQGLRDRDLGVRLAFPNGLRGDLLTPEQLRDLRDAGCYSITFAVETASDRLQRLIRKRLDVGRVLENAQRAADLGMITSGFVMLGFPTETRDEMEATVRAVEASAIDLPRVFTVCPYPGTDLHALAVEHGFDPGGRAGEAYDYDHGMTNASTLADDELRAVVGDAHARFLAASHRRARLASLVRTHPRPDHAVFQAPFWQEVRASAGDIGAEHDARWAFAVEEPRPVEQPDPVADVLLLLPPTVVDFQYPELGMPQLAGYLRAQGADVSQRDLNADFLRHLVQPRQLARLQADPTWRREPGGAGDAISLAAEVNEDANARRTAQLALVALLRLQPPGPDLHAVLDWARAEHPVLDPWLRARLLGPPPAVAGLSVCTSTQLGVALKAARVLRQRGCGCVVLGGPWARAARDRLGPLPALFDEVDAVVVGVGERPLEAILLATRRGEPLEGLPDVAVRVGGAVQLGPPAAPVPLVDLPAPAFDGLDLGLYSRGWLPVRTRRGCPWARCAFCHHVVDGDRGDGLPVERVVDEFERVVEAFGVRSIELANLSTPAVELAGIAQEILRRGLQVRWSSLARIESGFSADVIRDLARSGCAELQLGLESADPDQLARLDKGVHVGDAADLLDRFEGSGIAINLFVLDVPGQPIEAFERTLQWCERRADQLSGVTVQRFRLCTGSPALTEPGALGLTVAEAGDHADVFDLPFQASGWHDEEAFVRRATRTQLRLAARRGPVSPWDEQVVVSRLRGEGNRLVLAGVKMPADVTVTLACNNDCVFCPRATLEHVAVSDTELAARLGQLREHSDRVVLSGGEVTCLHDPAELVRACADLGFTDIGLITNGRALADPELAQALVDAGLTEVCVTVYDLRPQVHDALTRTSGSLAQTLAGLDVLLHLATRRPDLSVRVNTVLCARNADGLAALVRQLRGRGVRGVLVADAVLSDAFDEPLDHGAVAALAAQIRRETPGFDVTWRGFPPCALRGSGVIPEFQDIDTAAAERADLEAYFAEFGGNFVEVEACGACEHEPGCRGLQRRYVQRFGEDSVRPPWRDPGRLAVTPTRACSMRCTYCGVDLGAEHAPPEVLDRAVDLLLASSRTDLELHFFGGEPLLRPAEVERTMARGAALAAQAGKRLHFTLTTNGLHLDAAWLDRLRRFDAHVLFSMDGPEDVMARYRPLASGGSPGTVVEDNLSRLVRSGVPHFVNLVVTPDAVGDLPRRVRHVAGLGVRTLQLCYANGPDWDRAARLAFCRALVQCTRFASRQTAAGRPLRLQNLDSDAEPTVLSNDLLVDVDGTVYGDAALFAEAVFPHLRGPYRVGDVSELRSYDGLRRSPERNLRILRDTYAEGSAERRTLEQLLALGREVQHTVDRLNNAVAAAQARGARVRDRNPLVERVLKRSLADQVAIMRERPGLLKLPLLMLENPCAHDCLFCKAKPLVPTPLDEARAWLADNREFAQPRLGLVGNEPLAHPDVDAVIAEARQCGFTRFETLTTAAPLAEPGRAEALVKAGVRTYAIPLWAADAATHDRITRSPGSHEITLRALRQLGELGADVFVHANVLQQNLGGLEALQRLVADELGLPLCLLPVRPKDANLPYAELVARYRDLIGLELSGLVAFPLCVAAQVQQPAVPPASIIADVLKVYVLDQPFVKPRKCDRCGLQKRCVGTFQAYLDLFGDGEITPA